MTAPVTTAPDPLANAETIQQNTATSAAPQALADRVDTLNAAGHNWMPSDMQTTLAAAPTSDSEMVQVADSIKASLAKSWNGFSEATDDNVLHKQPTAALALTRMMNASLGPLPIAQPDLGTIQRNLQKLGFGADLSTDGVWDAGWNDAYNAYTNHLIQRQIAGDQPGSTSVGHAAHSVFSDLLPSHALNAIVGFAKSIPGSVRNLAADSLSSAVNLAHDPLGIGQLLNPVSGIYAESTAQNQSAVAKRVGAAVQSVGGSNVTPEQYEHAHGVARLAQNVGLLLNLVPIAGEGSAALDVARAEFAEGVTKDAAARTGGVVSKSLWYPKDAGVEIPEDESAPLSLKAGLARNPEAAQRGPGVVARSLLGGQTTDQAAAGLERRGILNSNAVRNIPLLGQVGPVVGKLADEDGLYYKARTLLASPYQYGAVRVAGDAGQRTMLTGAAVRAGAQAQQAAGINNAQTSDITNTNATNFIDLALDGVTGSKAAHPFTDAVNALGYVLHGPLGDTANSVRVGDAVDAARDAGAQMLGQYGAEGVWERAITKATGQKTTIADLHKSFGSSDEFERFMQMKIADLAAAHHAQNQAQTVDGLTFGDDGYREAVGRHADDVWNNPDLHQTAIRELMAQDGGVGLENRVAVDAVRNSINPKNGRASTGSASLDSYTHNAKAWMAQGAKVTDWVRNGDARYLFGGQGQALIREAQDNFDFGMGQSSPLRLGTASSRQQFTRQVTQSFNRVQRGVDKARTITSKGIADAQQRLNDATDALTSLPEDHPDRDLHAADQEQARNDLAAAKQRNSQIEAAISANDMDRLASIMKDIAGPKAAHVDWDQLVNDHRRLKAMIGQTLEPGQTFDLADALTRGSLSETPDTMYTRLNGEPRIPDEDIGSGDWISQHVNTSQGALGIARLDTKTIQQATADINGFRARIASLDPDNVEQRDALADEMADYGFNEFGLTRRTLGLYNEDPDKLADRLQEYADDLASDVFITPDAPTRLREQVTAMRVAGYKPVLGSHIGHLWDGSLPPIEDLKGAVTKRRRFTDGLGLGLNSISPRTAGQDASIRVLREVDRALHDPKATLPRNLTAESVLQVLRDDNLLAPEMKLPERVAFTITKKLHQPGINELAKSTGGDVVAAQHQYEQELSRALQVRDIPRRQMMKALTTPGEGVGPSGPWQWEGLDTPTAALVIRAIQRGYADRPNYIQGLGALEDKFRGGGWILDKLAVKFPNTGPIQAFANAPNDLIELRNRARFGLNPFFDFRRIAKTNVKMGFDGVTGTLNPLKYLIDHDQLTTAHAYLDKLIGAPPVAGFDEADRYLHEQSIWGMYNSRHYEAYYAMQKKAAGATDDEVRAGIRRVFEYGSERNGGRTPLERSVNTIFFPFSFEKTLLRNTGAYLLDHPQQALLLTSGMEAYRRANKNDAISQWSQDHLPLLRDLQKMNAFAHGISPGEFGGLNAPLLNLFLPQEWGHDFTKTNLKQNLPIWSDFGQLMSDTLQQGEIARNAGENAVSYATNLGKPRAFLDPYKPTITPEAQRRKAEVMKNQAILAFTPALNYNAHQDTDADKITFPDDPSLPAMIQGQPVNRTTIGYLIQRWYPAYDPSFGVTYAEQQDKSADEYIANLRQTDPAKAQQYAVFSKLANVVQGHLERGDYDTAESAEVMTQFRQAATDASETDPGFYAFFRDHYSWEFGPLEGIKTS